MHRRPPRFLLLAALLLGSYVPANSVWENNPAQGDDSRGEIPRIRQAAIQALGGRNGLMVVVDPTNGRILTVVNQKLAFSSGFQPCSTFKPAVGLAALQEDLLGVETEIRVRRRTYMTLTEALAVSNNPFFSHLGRKLGFQRVRKYAQRFGFGEKTGWNIPGESAGTFPSRPPRRGVGYLSSHGYGIQATALQMAAFYSALANGGHLYYLQYPRTRGQIVNFQPHRKRKLPMSKNMAKLKNGMAATVLYGTGNRAFGPEYVIYGKTGTCSQARRRLGWFVSYARVGHQQYVVSVLLQDRRRARASGSLAAAVAGRFYRELHRDSPRQAALMGISGWRNPGRAFLPFPR